MKHIIIIILAMAMVVPASAGTANVAQVGDTVFVYGSGWADMTYIETLVANTSALTHTGTVFTAGASIHVNGTGTKLFINDSDCTYLKLDCTGGHVSNLRVDGHFDMADSKITSWNTTAGAVVGQTSGTLTTPRPAIRFGDDSDSCYVDIADSEISHCGYSTSGDVYGLYFNRWMSGTITNTYMHHLYAIQVVRSQNNVIDGCKIYNNSARGLEMYHYSNGNRFIDTEIYYNHHNLVATGYGAGLWTEGESNNDLHVYNCTIRDNNGAQITLQSGNNATVSHCEIYGDNRLLEFNGVTNSLAEYNTVHDGWRGLYNVYGSTNTYRHNIAYNCTSGGITVYGILGGSCMMWNNTAYNNEYNIYFVSDSSGTKICNNTISGAATSVDIAIDDGYNDAQVQDLNNYDNDLSIRLWHAGRSLSLNYTDNKIMGVTPGLAYYTTTNTYHAGHSSLYMMKDQSEEPHIITAYLYNGTLTPNSGTVTISSVNAWTETAGGESYNITVNSTNPAETCVFAANVTNATGDYGCYVDGMWSENVAVVDGIVSWTYTGGFSEHDLEIRWNSSSASGGSNTTSIILIAIVEGAAGNTIVTTETMTNGAFGAATLTGGLTDVSDWNSADIPTGADVWSENASLLLLVVLVSLLGLAILIIRDLQ